jgi:hypothetical protein
VLLDISIAKSKSKPEPELRRGEEKIARRFEDGSAELVDWKGRRRRVYCYTCPRCKQLRPSFMFSLPRYYAEVMPDYACNPCNTAAAQARALARAKEIEAHRRYLIETGNTPAKRRAATLALASPKWRDTAQINAIYAEARKLSLETGVKYDVDHIHPVMGCLSTGLHVPWNLQILEASINRSKSDSISLDQSPAWDGVSEIEFRREVRLMLKEFEERESAAVDSGRKITPNQARS